MDHDTRNEMPSGWELLLRGLAALGLGASALLLWEYLADAPRFCSQGQGCDLVRLSAYAKLFGIHTPVYGVLFFGGVLIFSFLRAELLRLLLLAGTAIGALGAAGFIFIMATVVHGFCVFCLIVDASALLLLPVVFMANKHATPYPRRAATLAPSIVLILLGLAAPFGVSASMHSYVGGPKRVGVPDSVVIEQREGVVTVVVFSDFICPYCRAEHFALKRLLDELGGDVRVVHKQFPLPIPGHEQAAPAARAAICAEEMGQGELMIDQLFAADDLSSAAIDQMAERVGMDLPAFKACLASKSTSDRLAKDLADGKSAEVSALPTLFIGRERFEGMQKDEVMRTALAQALAATVRASAQGQP